ncbi:disintegrin and metalloproteinase domain-containing protein 9-like [Eleutherodactylus coqui]|uniref:disintegrin and metalloproteinase domain-containing protein 9-like n=1 Tax=Eleutherodactylus coqui TaxID=57060 RepID=UPI003462F60A
MMTREDEQYEQKRFWFYNSAFRYVCLEVVKSHDLLFVEDIEIVEGEVDSPHWNESQPEDSDLLPYTEDVNRIVIPILMEKTNNSSKELSYMITLDKNQYILHLVRNSLLTTPDFRVFSHESQQLYSYEPHIPTMCYYQGYIEDHPHSAAAINICSGLSILQSSHGNHQQADRLLLMGHGNIGYSCSTELDCRVGTMYTDQFMYIIEPDGPLMDFRHHVYNIEASEPELKCDLNISSLVTVGASMDIAKETHDRKTAYLELFMVVSYLQYQFHDENTTSLIESMLELINHVNTVFQALNTQIVLVGLEIWSNGNLINTERELANEILSEFLEWKKKSLDSRMSYDAVGLSLRESRMSSSGLAHWGGACDPDNSAFISMMDRDKLVVSSATFIHDLGHVLGMKHDAMGCSCQSGKLACAMAEEGLLSSSFSDCSVLDMETFYASDNADCLWNVPASDVSSVKAQCGNNILEIGEDCDCGSVELCQNLCCNPVICKLKENATCSSGPCCLECKFRAAGTACRFPSTECDLAEYCNGTSSSCPTDVYHQDGSPCNDGQSVCYEKNCYDYSEHCKRLFGEGANVAPLSCFQALNTAGDRFGNCGIDGEFLQCDIQDVMCGQIQCWNVSRNFPPHERTSYVTTPIGDVLCWGLDHKGSGDEIAVPDGALCGKGKICLDRKCVDFSLLKYDCDTKKKCSGKGVCNDRKNCHCDMKWAPPYCNSSGYGGSVDSGPLTKNSFIRYASPRQAKPRASSVVKRWDGSMITLACLSILACSICYGI